ncbi:AraC family transcriptional regulator [Mycolicibacterium chubuense]|uniref:HTH-type transcriptional activator RhaS n=1 Tax=Mycolicibacterium chubuense TaxID=1800 RepID=A0A0J6VTU9_MYCCU|nr:AraC family transcriptional regulator [Mycolicibacterium chubuense]KMO72903.1 HTH-type transcriptional activator RhaS [Mycolicibacterium chubuense]ORA56522.1 AraC family transcriptional regulator [Mycolicibacterium chubuense]SPX99048.1 helix-turn-helix domain-containing protein [Mycolicibacterium chubuense]
MTSSDPAHDDLVFDSTDLAATEDFLVRAYTKMSIGADDGEATSAHIERQWVGPVSFDELRLDFTMSYDAAPLGRVCLCRVHDGRIEENFIGDGPDVFAPGDVALLSPPDLPYSGRVRRASFDLTMFDTALLDRVASSARPADGVRLTGHRPVSAAAHRRLSRTIDYVRSVAKADEPPTPLVASTTSSMLAAVVLSTLPSNAVVEPTATDRTDAKPELLRRAVAFIDDSADRDVTLVDIAESVHVTPRALQYMFRKHLDMTPMEYLRRVRMDHAHRELLRSDPASTTVGIVAARWGFAHTGRFAGMYRQAYGVNPSDSLRR